MGSSLVDDQAHELQQSQPDDVDRRPSLARDRSFHGLLVSQFLGAFNDNLFKQLVLLLCVDLAARGAGKYEGVALGLFALPFVAFSGFGGYLSDKYSKRSIVVICKVGEICVMGAALLVFAIHWPSDLWQLLFVFVALFMMSTQSAFFGPAKYGILPELFRDRDLPSANGMFQMTTFVAIIFGMAMGGVCKEWLGNERLWMVSGICVLIAIIGTLASTLVRSTPIARPDLTFSTSALFINRQTWKLLWSDRALLLALGVSSVFWFIGGIVQPAVNNFGRLQMGLSDGRTSLLASCMGIGIAIGCMLAGQLSHHRINFRLVTWGSWGICGFLLLLGWMGLQIREPLSDSSDPTRWQDWLWPATGWEFVGRLALTGLGTCAGIFVVPLQVFLQSRPPRDQKGRMIGTMNLINWIGIVFSAVFYWMFQQMQSAIGENAAAQPILATSWLFPILGVLMVPIALRFRQWMQNVGVV